MTAFTKKSQNQITGEIYNQICATTGKTPTLIALSELLYQSGYSTTASDKAITYLLSQGKKIN